MAVRWGILGCAGIAEKFCASVSRADNAEVAAVGSRSMEKAEQFIAENCPGAKAYGSYQELLTDASIQAVYIPVPTTLKTDLALEAISAKKHILIEKPLINVTDTQKMIDACKSQGVQFMDNTMFVHNARQLAMRKILDDSERFGRVKHVQSTFSIDLGNDENWAKNNIRMKKSLEPLGCLGDLGWYNIRFTLRAYNYALPTSVSCRYVECTDEGVPTHVMAQMCFEGGRTASFMCSFTSAFRDNAEVFGEKLSLSLEDFVVTSALDTAPFKVVKTGFGSKAETFPVEFKDEEVQCGVQHTAVVEAFSKTVLSGIDETWPRQTLDTQTVLDAMVLSASHDGAWLQVTR